MTQLALGVVGAGGFATFLADAVRNAPAVRVVAVADLDPAAASTLAERVGARAVSSDDMLSDPTVDAVVVATPPSTHAAIALAALDAGKHVFSEKPMALTVADARAVRDRAMSAGLTYAVDHVLRFNPVVAAVAGLLGDAVLRPVQRFAFENDAGDETLGSDHWFWDASTSGGILLEHAVHFFDAASLLVGSPAVRVQAIGHARADGRVDTVVATVEHANGALASHAHGFSHPGRAEQQLMRLDCGTAEVRIDGWVPLRATIVGWFDEGGIRALEQFAAAPRAWTALPGVRVLDVADVRLAAERDAAPAGSHSRDRDLAIPHHARLVVDIGWPAAKAEVYARSVRAALLDFAAAVRDGTSPRADAESALATVELGCAAAAALAEGRTVRVRA